MPPPFLTQRRVEFRDTDAAGIVHFSAFFPMMESAEHEFLRHVAIPVLPPHDADDRVTWPRISATCDYHAAARFEDVLQIAVVVEHVGNSSVRYRFDFSLGETKIATGKITVVCCQLDHGHLTKVTIPESIRQKLGADKLGTDKMDADKTGH